MNHRRLQLPSPAPCGNTRRWQQRRRRPLRGAFTLTELLVVIGIIVLVAIVAVPSFRALTGGRSTEAAQNQLAGMLGRARAEAIGLQQVRGIMFFLDRESQRVSAVMVKQAQTPPPGALGVQPDIYLDMVEDREPVLMPVGVGVQMVDDAVVNTQGTPNPADDVRSDDAYIGFNRATIGGVTFDYGGAILFDGYGRIVSKTYGLKFHIVDGAGVKRPSNLANHFGMPSVGGGNDLVPLGPPRSQFGFVIYDQPAFDDLGFTAGDPQIDGTTSYGSDAPNWEDATGEAKEERWLDANATPVLVNRNNGTLVKGM